MTERPGGESAKRAEATARQMERMIVERGWPVGEVLGSEGELMATLGVSRAVFREAVRLLEHHFVARMRPGPGGGLVVAEPDHSAVSRAMALHMIYAKVDAKQLLALRIVLEAFAVEMACETATEAEIAELRAYIQAEGESLAVSRIYGEGFHHLVPRLTHNPAIELFVDCLLEMTERQPSQTHVTLDTANEVHRAHSAIAEAIAAGDAAIARRRMVKHLEAIEPFLTAPRGGEEDPDNH